MLALDDVTPVVSVAVLLVVSGSLVSLETDAVLIKAVAVLVLTVTVLVIVAQAPLAMVPRLQGRFVLHPCEEIRLDKVTPAGRVSFTSTFAASFGPALLTIKV